MKLPSWLRKACRHGRRSQLADGTRQAVRTVEIRAARGGTPQLILATDADGNLAGAWIDHNPEGTS